MGVTVKIDTDEFERGWRAGLDALTTGLEHASLAAAEEGVAAAKQSHPYTDRTGALTGTSVAKPNALGMADMIWPEEYAGFVDQGTSRANPYPFTPLAMQVADRGLEHETTEAVENFRGAIER